jgi:hypothetical protein
VGDRTPHIAAAFKSNTADARVVRRLTDSSGVVNLDTSSLRHFSMAAWFVISKLVAAKYLIDMIDMASLQANEHKQISWSQPNQLETSLGDT